MKPKMPGMSLMNKDEFSSESATVSSADLIRSALFFFAPASVLSLVAYSGIKAIWPEGDLWKEMLLIVLLIPVHLGMLLFLRPFMDRQITRKIYLCSTISGLATAPVAVLLNVHSVFLSYNYSPWEAAGMILLMSMVAGWGATIIPYLGLALRYDLMLYFSKKKPGQKVEGASGAPERPVYASAEFRYEYMYDTVYRLKDIPLIEIYHNNSHSGYLDPRWYKIHGYGPGDLGECFWRIILKRRNVGWVEVSSRISQAEGDDPREFAPPALESRVSKAVERVLGIQNEAFSFYHAAGELPEIDEKVSCFDKNINQTAPLYIPLEELIRPVVEGIMNREMALGIQLELARVPDATHIIDVVDTLDYSHYYIAVHPGQDHKKVIRDIEVKTMQLVHKVWEM